MIGYYDYGFTAADQTINPIPNWVWLIAAFNIFLAYTLGKELDRIITDQYKYKGPCSAC